MPTTPVAKEQRQSSHLPRESDPRAPPHFPPSPPIPAKLFKVPSPLANPVAIPPSPDVDEFVPPSPLFSPPPRRSSAPTQSSAPSSCSSPVPAPNFSASPLAATTTLSISCTSATISPAKSSHANNFNNVPINPSASSSSSSAFTFSSPIVTSSRPRSSSSSPLFLPLPKSPSLSPNSAPVSPPTSPSLDAISIIRTPERSPRRPAPQLPSHPPPSSGSRKNSQNSPLGPSTTPNFPPPPIPASPQSPPSVTTNLLASLASIPLQSPPTSSSHPLTSAATTTITSDTTAPNTTTTNTATATPISTTTSIPNTAAIVISSTTPALTTSVTTTFPSNIIATTTTSATTSSSTPTPIADARTPTTSSTPAAISETPTKTTPPPPSIQTALSPSTKRSASIASPVRVRGKHPSGSPTHLKIRSVSVPPPLVVKSPDSASSAASMASFSSSPSSSCSSSSSGAAESSSFSANPCAPIPEGSSELPESPSNENTAHIDYILRESSSSPPVPSSWGKEFRPDVANIKPPPVLCGRCEKVVDKQKPAAVEEVKKAPSFHSPIYEDPANVAGNLKMSRQGLSKRFPMKTRWCVFHPALCTLWYWRTSARGAKARCLFVTGVTNEKASLQFALLLQFRGRVLLQASSEADFELWKQGFARAFDIDDNQEALRIVLPPEDHKTDGLEARESGSMEIRPRASTLDRVRSIFVQEFNNTLWRPNKTAKKKPVVEVRDEAKGELWHVGSAPLVRVDVP